jgi:hypothetical protein
LGNRGPFLVTNYELRITVGVGSWLKVGCAKLSTHHRTG